MKTIPIISRRIIEPLPFLVAGCIKDQEFIAVQSDPPEFIQQKPEFFLGSQTLQSIPDDAIIQLDEFQHASTPYQLRARLIYRRESEEFSRLHTLGTGLGADSLESFYWLAVEPMVMSGQVTREDWLKAAKFMNDSLTGTVPNMDFAHEPLPREPEPVNVKAPDGVPTQKSVPETAKVAFGKYLAAHGQPAADTDAPAGEQVPPLPSVSTQMLYSLFKENRRYYPASVADTLERLLNKGGELGHREQSRAMLLLQYGFCRPPASFRPFDHTCLTGEPLIGRDTALQTLDQILVRAEQTHQPQTVLINAPLGHGGGCLLNRLRQAAGSRSIGFVDGNESGISLTGTSSIYDQATEGSVLHEAFLADIIVVQNFDTAWYSRTSDKDSAFPALNALLSRHIWSDKFLGISLPVSASLILVLTRSCPEEMARSCNGLFMHTIDLSADYTLEEKCQILQQRAARNNLTLTLAAAKAVVLDYAPISMTKAVHLVDRLCGPLQGTCDLPDVSRCLHTPALSPEERLASRYGHHRNELCPAARDLADEQMQILCNSTSSADRYNSKRILSGILDCLPAATTLPPQKEIRSALDRNLLGMNSLKDLVSIWAASSEERRGLLLVGPPGVAKTALSLALSGALGYGEHIVRLDMSHLTKLQLCGTGKAYGGTPGQIAEFTQRYKGVQIPFVFDELDKASPDVLYALLELLDSGFFADSVYGPIDQRKRPLIFTANETDRIARPLLDRLIVVHVAPYCREQKIHLAAFLWQRRMPLAAPLPRKLAETLVDLWAPSGGARDLQQVTDRLAAACSNGSWDLADDDLDSLREVLGKERFCPPPVSTLPGMSYALAANSDGSGLLTPVQAVFSDKECNLGLGTDASMTDSASLARFLAQRLAGKNARPALLAMDAAPGERRGPSAGLAEFLALYGLFQGLASPGAAATGQLLAQGQILPVGAVHCKVDAAVRCKAVVHHLFLPEGNREDVGPELRRALEEADIRLYFVSHVGEAAHILNTVAARLLSTVNR